MNEQTEKLREKLAELEHKQWAHWSRVRNPSHPLIDVPYAKLTEEVREHDRYWADYVVQACKEAGLKFVPDEFNLSYIERPSTSDAVWWAKTKELISNDINSQIKEIEL